MNKKSYEGYTILDCLISISAIATFVFVVYAINEKSGGLFVDRILNILGLG